MPSSAPTPSPNPEKAKHSWRESAIWKALSDGSTGITWLQLAIACITLWRSQGWKMMPNLGTNPIGAIAASGAVFCGTMCVAAGVTRVASLIIPKVKRWRNPPLLVLISRTTSRLAGVELMHYGEEATWEARIRVIERVDGGAIENPFARQYVLRKDGKTYRSLPMLRQRGTFNRYPLWSCEMLEVSTVVNIFLRPV